MNFGHSNPQWPYWMIIKFLVKLIRTYNITNKSKQIFYPLIKKMEKKGNIQMFWHCGQKQMNHECC